MESLVTIPMLTYNHEKYVAHAIESVLKQKADFRFELVIGDDCSTDGTRAIIEGYARRCPDQIKLLLSGHNIGIIENVIRIMNACRGKYIAIIEGDDFWNDDSKLQKQVDFLEHNPEYGLVHSDVNHWYEENGNLVENFNALHHIQIPEGYIYDELMDSKKYIIKTPTTVFRKELFDQYVDYGIVREKGWELADLFTWLSMARFTKFKYIPEALATYRVLRESAGNSEDFEKKIKIHRSVFGIRFYFAEKYQGDEAMLEKLNNHYVRALLYDAFKISDKKLSLDMRKYSLDHGIKLGLKGHLLYYGARNPLIHRLLDSLLDGLN